MSSWFRSRPWARPAAPADPAAPVAATKGDLDAAYRRGRQDEHRRRRGSPLLTLIGVLAVAAVALFVYLAIQTGSASNGGALVDQKIANASETVTAPVKNAESRAGAALENAGQSLKQKAGDTSQP